MALGSAYGIEKYKDADGALNKDYMRYHTIRTALLFGYKIERISNDKIILYDGRKKTAHCLIIDNSYPYKMFVANMEKLTSNYNVLLVSEAKSGTKVMPAELYGEEHAVSDDKAEQAYPYGKDPVLKAALLKDKMAQQKGEAFAKEVDEEMKRATVVLKEVNWGKPVAEATEYFWHHNRRNLLPEESIQLGE